MRHSSELLMLRELLGAPELAIGVRSENSLVSYSSNISETTGKIPSGGQVGSM